jgi:hypothetical protein
LASHGQVSLHHARNRPTSSNPGLRAAGSPEGNITRRVPKKAAAHNAPEANQKLRPLEGGVTKKIGTTEARQGETPHIVRYMLGISLVAAIVALAIVGVVLIR